MKKNKNVLLFIAAILAISLVSGFIYGMNQDINISDYLNTLTTNNNLFLIHILSIISIFFSTLALINCITGSIIFGVEGISIGFILGVMFKNYKLNGILFGLSVTLVNKLIFLILITYLFIISIKYINKIIRNILGISNDYIKVLLKPLIQRFLIILVISIINDVIIYFFGNMLLNYLTFML